MATYHPPSIPRRPSSKSSSNFFHEIRYQLQLAYYRYEVNTGQYVMSPGEKLACNAILLGLLALLVTSLRYAFPSTLRVSVHGLGYYMAGLPRQTLSIDMSGDHAGGLLAKRVLEAASSLKDGGGMANASSACRS
ncbi:hypothetical protein B0A50_03994 [Salinomyces thailandicus]|uniref:Uncharacterized protein n=1 Tax=Salinomyces thailandicus TaxID=706561 RepID=A0A4V5N4I8_9PEZI|nr:hypothetical protein B0A50_03994 [Salinomyces thailandica]